MIPQQGAAGRQVSNWVREVVNQGGEVLREVVQAVVQAVVVPHRRLQPAGILQSESFTRGDSPDPEDLDVYRPRDPSCGGFPTNNDDIFTAREGQALFHGRKRREDSCVCTGMEGPNGVFTNTRSRLEPKLMTWLQTQRKPLRLEQSPFLCVWSQSWWLRASDYEIEAFQVRRTRASANFSRWPVHHWRNFEWDLRSKSQIGSFEITSH